MVHNFLNELNSVQKQAVTFPQGNLLVLAGAGSGKTRVLVYRIAWLLSQGINLQNILAVTFTNKAASEMRSRLEQILHQSLANLWIGTFHGLSNRLLRLHAQDAGFTQSFQIIDADDQLRLLKRIHKELNLSPDKYLPQDSQIFINRQKERGLRASSVSADDPKEKILARIYQIYEGICKTGDLVDFAELLLATQELWRQNPTLLQHYKEKFQYILVDEFQDTNSMQYAWIKALFGPKSHITAVGDDDQSIYSWRGADSNNMQRLSKDYQDLHTVRLEQNYRSTGIILEAANAVIAHNNKRLGKNLWTESSQGEPIAVYSAFNEIDEARYIVEQIKFWTNQNNNLKDVAILYRSNAQSRVLEEQLLRSGVSYRIYGGIRFFERAEIKDVLSYLRLLINRNDDAAFERVVNLPARGLGESTVMLLRDKARADNLSLWQAAQSMLDAKQLTARLTNALSGFMQVIKEGSSKMHDLNLAELVLFIINISGLKSYYADAKRSEYKQSRLENLDELISAAQQFATMNFNDNARGETLQPFLTHVALEAGEYVDNSDGDCVNLMTLHAAKGLEFPVVFLCGMEEGLFPHAMSMNYREGLEEERRLCYVGMTRAMQKLHMIYAASRRLHGKNNQRKMSRFLREIPFELTVSNTIVNSVQPALVDDNSNSQIEFGENKFHIGQNVQHDYFGEGIITGFDGYGESMLVQIKFKKYGSKMLSMQYAPLRVMSR